VAVSLSVIVPFHRGLALLDRCLAAVALPRGSELIVVADGAVEDCRAVAARYGARVIEIDGPSGPAVARNRGASGSTGDILVFIDTDVVVAPTALSGIARVFDEQPETSAVFGAYDEEPGDPGFVSQYKNLAHSYIHQSSSTIVHTFWSGLGAVRREAFERVGGFDEGFGRPSVEDIDLGYRLSAAGCRIVLDPSLRACHLKRWTLWGMICSDVLDRGIPWTQLILRHGRMNNDLNLNTSYRLCVVLAYLAVGSVLLGMLNAWYALASAPLLGSLVMLSRPYYTYFLRQRGIWFAVRVFPLHFLYHLYNGFSFATGTMLFLTNRWFGVQLPFALASNSPIGSATIGIEARPVTASN
jgi:glycosyltransferase involved in cell wall biosynthesis